MELSGALSRRPGIRYGRQETFRIFVGWFRCFTKIWMIKNPNFETMMTYDTHFGVWFSQSFLCKAVRCWGMPKCRIARSFQICGLGLGKRARQLQFLVADRAPGAKLLPRGTQRFAETETLSFFLKAPLCKIIQLWKSKSSIFALQARFIHQASQSQESSNGGRCS